ncbi:NAD-dependent epimerase/dehydratase family protein [Spiribacter insolitus]|uniref:NAD-dependent epimerase/dehydratase family protein n=1 Tax=Spiribacter insolitus TaxID=3122417 RepID=A0ABV3TBB0_9GAMM
MPYRIAVTGANGFIGTALCPALTACGHQIIAQTRRSDPPRRATGGVQWVAFEISDAAETQWRSLLDGADAVVHLAAQAHERATGQSLRSLRAANVEAVVNLARQAREVGIKRLVYLSSIGVLGQSSSAPLVETDAPAPADPYAWSKYEAEKALWEIVSGTDMSLTVIRPPLVHGPGAPGNFGRLLGWARKGRLLPLGAVTGNQRSLVGRQNLVDFIHRALTHPQAGNQTFHVADDETVSTTDLLRMLAHAAGQDPKLVGVPPVILRTGARLLGRRAMIERLLGSLTVDTRKARDLLGWRPPLSLEQGLREAVIAHPDAESAA